MELDLIEVTNAADGTNESSAPRECARFELRGRDTAELRDLVERAGAALREL